MSHQTKAVYPLTSLSKGWIVLFLLLSLLIHGCGTHSAIKGKEAVTSLAFLGISQEGQYPNMAGLNYSSLNTILEGQHSKDEVFVRAACQVSPTKENAFIAAAPILALVAKVAIDYAVEAINEAVQERLALYTQNFSGNVATTNFYYWDNHAGSQPFSPELRYPCLRLTRWTDDKKTEVAMDFIMRLQVIKNAMLKVSPLRLFYSESHALRSDEKLGVAIRLTGNAVWRQANRGMKEKGFIHTQLLKEKVTLDGKSPFYQRYDYSSSDSLLPQEVIVPLPPWSVEEPAAQVLGRPGFAQATPAQTQLV
ncbi:MAG: hypothetical protein KDD43_11335, partial [Bdellovibrionales bacterium]|nr:hypothetical protein [Bdellovibrionales bacterium]